MKNNQQGFGLVWILLIILLLVLLGFAGWRVYDSRDAEEGPEPAQSAEQAPAEDEVADGQVEEVDFVISESLRENIVASIQSGNTAALEGYMTNPVTVVFAASEKGGPETPAEAVTDLDYISSAIAPWDFDLEEATLASYGAGFYGQYFGENAVVGQSADNFVISFKINNSNKIETMFVSASADLLL